MRAIVVAVLVVAAGCAQPTPVALEPAPLAELGTDWAFVLGGGCGFCSGGHGVAHPAESFVLVVLRDGGLLLFHTNGGWAEPRQLHLAQGIPPEAQRYAGILAHSQRADGETWMIRLYTARIDADRVEAWARQWYPRAPDVMCTDVGFDVARQAEGKVEHVEYSCGPEGGPMAELTEDLFEVAARIPREVEPLGVPGKLYE